MAKNKSTTASLRTAAPVRRAEVSGEFRRALSDVKNHNGSKSTKGKSFRPSLRPSSSS